MLQRSCCNEIEPHNPDDFFSRNSSSSSTDGSSSSSCFKIPDDDDPSFWDEEVEAETATGEHDDQQLQMESSYLSGMYSYVALYVCYFTYLF